MAIQTYYYSIRPSRYVRIAMGVWFGRWWWIVTMPLVVLVIASIQNIVYVVAALALVLICYPGIMALMYMNHALRPEAAFGIIPHRLTITEDAIRIHYKSPDATKDDVKDGELPAHQNKEAGEQSAHRPAYHIPDDRIIHTSSIARVEDIGRSVIITLTTSDYDFIEIPNSAFTDHADITRLLAR